MFLFFGYHYHYYSWENMSAGQLKLSAAEGRLLARGNNNAQQAVQDHKPSLSFINHHYWSPSVVTGKRKEEELLHLGFEVNAEQTV